MNILKELFKSKQEKETERRMQVKQGRRKVERHIKNQKKQEKRYWEMAQKAYKLGNKDMLLKLARLIAQTRQNIKMWDERMLYFDMIEAMRDQALAGAEFAKAFQSMSESILASADPAMLNKIQLDLEKSSIVAEELEDRLEDFQSSMDDMLEESSSEEREELSEIMSIIRTEAEKSPEDALDPETAALEAEIDRIIKGQAI